MYSNLILLENYFILSKLEDKQFSQFWKSRKISTWLVDYTLESFFEQTSQQNSREKGEASIN